MVKSSEKDLEKSIKEFSDREEIGERRLTKYSENKRYFHISSAIASVFGVVLIQTVWKEFPNFSIFYTTGVWVFLLLVVVPGAFAYHFRKKYRSENINRDRLILHEIAQLINSYYEDTDSTKIRGRVSDLHSLLVEDMGVLGTTKFSSKTRKSLKSYNKKIRKAERRGFGDKFVENTFEEFIYSLINHIEFQIDSDFYREVEEIKSSSFEKYNGKGPLYRIENAITNSIKALSELNLDQIYNLTFSLKSTGFLILITTLVWLAEFNSVFAYLKWLTSTVAVITGINQASG